MPKARWTSWTNRADGFDSAPAAHYWPLPGEILDQVRAVARMGRSFALKAVPRPGDLSSTSPSPASTSPIPVVLSARLLCRRPCPRRAASAPRSAVLAGRDGVPGAVWGRGLRRSVFEACVFSNLGGFGLELARACSENRVLRCEFADLGPAASRARDNHSTPDSTRQRGELFPTLAIAAQRNHSAIGIWIGQSPTTSEP